MRLNPKKIEGNWDEGYVLDVHTVSSIPIGENAYGHMQFDTERSELGELVFQLKNRNKLEVIEDILELIKPFLDGWTALETIESVLPVPPSKENRIYQPVQELAEAIASYLGVSYSDEVLVKTTSAESKNLSNKEKEDIAGSIVKRINAKRKHSMLLVDDLFQSGRTLEECVAVLKTDANIDSIFVLAMTHTKR